MTTARKPTAKDRLRRGSPLEQPAGPRTVTGDVRVKPVRISTDLTPSDYRFLKDFAHTHDLGHSEVFRRLLAQLATDPDLAARVTGLG